MKSFNSIVKDLEDRGAASLIAGYAGRAIQKLLAKEEINEFDKNALRAARPAINATKYKQIVGDAL